LARPFELEARAKGSDDSLSPFKLSISEPSAEATGEFGCFLECVFLGFERHKVFGVDADQATALALWLVEDQLKHHGYVLVDNEGGPIQLPTNPDAFVPGQTGASPIPE